MKVSTEQREPREAVITIELDNADVEPYLDQAYRQAVRRLAIPGFRKGKAPRRIVEQMYGRGYLLNEALDTVIQEFTSKAVENEGLDLGGIPSVSLTDFDPPSFVATVPLQPLVELGDLDSVRVPKDEATVEEERVDGVLEQLRTDLAVWEPAEDAVQMNDLINLTIVGWVEEDGERKEIVQSEATDYIPRPDTTFPLPGLDEGLVGLPQGEPSTFEVEVGEDASNPELAGKTAHFEVEIHSIKRRKLAELDDEFAKGAGEGFESLASLKDKIRGDLIEREEQLVQAKHQEEALTQVLEGASIQISPIIIDHELEHYVHDREEGIKAGRVSFEEYQEYLAWQGLSEEEVHEQVRPKVEERLKRAHVVRALSVQQAFEATDEEVAEEIESLLGESVESAAALRSLFDDPERRESIRRMLVNRKTLAYLSEIALGDAPKQTLQGDTEAESGADSESAEDSAGEQESPEKD